MMIRLSDPERQKHLRPCRPDAPRRIKTPPRVLHFYHQIRHRHYAEGEAHQRAEREYFVERPVVRPLFVEFLARASQFSSAMKQFVPGQQIDSIMQ